MSSLSGRERACCIHPAASAFWRNIHSKHAAALVLILVPILPVVACRSSSNSHIQEEHPQKSGEAETSRLLRQRPTTTENVPIPQSREQAAGGRGGAEKADYPTLLSMVASRVEQEMPASLPSDWSDPILIFPTGGSATPHDSRGQVIPRFLALSVDLVETSDDGKITGMLAGLGIKSVREFLEHGLNFHARRLRRILSS